MREANLGIHGQLQEKCENVKDCDNLDLGQLGDNAETQFLAIVLVNRNVDFMIEANFGIHAQLQEKCENVKDCDNLERIAITRRRNSWQLPLLW